MLCGEPGLGSNPVYATGTLCLSFIDILLLNLGSVSKCVEWDLCCICLPEGLRVGPSSICGWMWSIPDFGRASAVSVTVLGRKRYVQASRAAILGHEAGCWASVWKHSFHMNRCSTEEMILISWRNKKSIYLPLFKGRINLKSGTGRVERRGKPEQI